MGTTSRAAATEKCKKSGRNPTNGKGLVSVRYALVIKSKGIHSFDAHHGTSRHIPSLGLESSASRATAAAAAALLAAAAAVHPRP